MSDFGINNFNFLNKINAKGNSGEQKVPEKWNDTEFKPSENHEEDEAPKFEGEVEETQSNETKLLRLKKFFRPRIRQEKLGTPEPALTPKPGDPTDPVVIKPSTPPAPAPEPDPVGAVSPVAPVSEVSFVVQNLIEDFDADIQSRYNQISRLFERAQQLSDKVNSGQMTAQDAVDLIYKEMFIDNPMLPKDLIVLLDSPKEYESSKKISVGFTGILENARDALKKVEDGIENFKSTVEKMYGKDLTEADKLAIDAAVAKWTTRDGAGIKDPAIITSDLAAQLGVTVPSTAQGDMTSAIDAIGKVKEILETKAAEKTYSAEVAKDIDDFNTTLANAYDKIASSYTSVLELAEKVKSGEIKVSFALRQIYRENEMMRPSIVGYGYLADIQKEINTLQKMIENFKSDMIEKYGDTLTEDELKKIDDTIAAWTKGSDELGENGTSQIKNPSISGAEGVKSAQEDMQAVLAKVNTIYTEYVDTFVDNLTEGFETYVTEGYNKIETVYNQVITWFSEFVSGEKTAQEVIEAFNGLPEKSRVYDLPTIVHSITGFSNYNLARFEFYPSSLAVHDAATGITFAMERTLSDENKAKIDEAVAKWTKTAEEIGGESMLKSPPIVSGFGVLFGITATPDNAVADMTAAVEIIQKIKQFIEALVPKEEASQPEQQEKLTIDDKYGNPYRSMLKLEAANADTSANKVEITEAPTFDANILQVLGEAMTKLNNGETLDSSILESLKDLSVKNDES